MVTVKIVKHKDGERESIYSWLKKEDSILLPMNKYSSFEEFDSQTEGIDFLLGIYNQDYLFIGLIEDFILPKEIVKSEVNYISDVTFNWGLLSSEGKVNLLEGSWKIISKFIPNLALDSSYCGEELKVAGFIKQNLNFPHEENESFLSSFDLPPIYTNFGNENLLLKWIQDYNAVPQEFELEIEVSNSKQFVWKSDLLPTRVFGRPRELAYGFSLFSKGCLSEINRPTTFISAYATNQVKRQFVGILTYEQLNANEYKFGIIDIHENYRKKGVATRLYQALNEQLSEDDILWTGMITPKGRECGIEETRNRIINKCSVKNIATRYL